MIDAGPGNPGPFRDPRRGDPVTERIEDGVNPFPGGVVEGFLRLLHMVSGFDKSLSVIHNSDCTPTRQWWLVLTD